ncbi:hypothetical protein YC68_23585 [Vibrio parahaemolyticus]|nr:hypothetical protein YC68_23585 [Vibrio parahaemolyticus]
MVYAPLSRKVSQEGEVQEWPAWRGTCERPVVMHGHALLEKPSWSPAVVVGVEMLSNVAFR